MLQERHEIGGSMLLGRRIADSLALPQVRAAKTLLILLRLQVEEVVEERHGLF